MLLMALFTFIFWDDIKRFSKQPKTYRYGLVCLIYTTLCSIAIGFLSFYHLLTQAF